MWFIPPELDILRKHPMITYRDTYEEVYVDDGDYVRRQYTARTLVSDLRITEEELMLRCDRNVRNEIRRAVKDGACRTVIGRANRLLHYEDMLWFKKSGYRRYDWGGYATDPKLASINAFKRGFGGEEIPRYYTEVVRNRWLKVAFRLLSKGE